MRAASSKRAPTRDLPRRAASMRGSPSCSLPMERRIANSEEESAWPWLVAVTISLFALRPFHQINRRARARVDVFAGDREAVLAIEAHRAGIVLVDMQLEPRRRQALGFVEQHFGDAGAPM